MGLVGSNVCQPFFMEDSMSKTTNLSFDGGVVVAPGGETTSTQVHNVFLHEITITDAGQESHIYALFDKNRPTSGAPFFENVSAFNFAEWCIRGDAVQVDLSEVMNSGTDRYYGLLQDLTLSNDPISGMYVRECTLRTMRKQGTTGVRFSWFSLSLVMDQVTSITYLATPVYNNPTTLDVPDHKVQVEQTDNPNYLAYKIMGDGSTVNVDIIRETSLGQPVDPFLRISARKTTDVIKWSDVLAVHGSDYSAFVTRIASDIASGIAPVVLDEDNGRLLVLYAKSSNRFYFIIQNSVQAGTSFVYTISADEARIYENQIIPRLPNGQVSINALNMAVVENNTSSTYTYTGSNPLDFIVTHPVDDVPNFAVTIKSTANTDGTVTIYDEKNGLYVPIMQSVTGGNTVEAGKTYQLTCVGDCWTLAEFEEPSDGLKTNIGDKLYNVVKIGSLYWMAENLAYNTTAETGDLNSASIWYDNDSSTYGDYGKLYCFTDASREEILAAAPGWRFPTQAEMEALFTESVADLKATTGWTNAGTDGTGFSGVPGGKYFEGDFGMYGTQGQWWCVPNDDPLTAVNLYYLTDDSKGSAFVGAASYASVRLVKDA